MGPRVGVRGENVRGGGTKRWCDCEMGGGGTKG